MIFRWKQLAGCTIECRVNLAQLEIPAIGPARAGKLRGTLKGMPGVPLLCVPPTRLTGVCSRVLKKLVDDII
jgi:hypothetical protein